MNDVMPRRLGMVCLLLWGVVTGLLVDGTTDFTKFVVRGVREEWVFGRKAMNIDDPLALVICIGLLVVTVRLFDKLPATPWLKVAVLVVSIVLVGVFDPWPIVVATLTGVARSR